jgi:hypothetical protein
MNRKITASLAVFALAIGLPGCASNTARVDDETAAARDTAPPPPPGYSGMERDTTQPQPAQTPTDTFLERQGTGAPQDTMGYSGIERVDTTGGQNGRNDTTGTTGVDTSGMSGGVGDSTRTSP